MPARTRLRVSTRAFATHLLVAKLGIISMAALYR